MNEMTNQSGDILNFVLPKDQSSYIKVIGVGGGGGNAVNHMYRAGIKGVDFIVCNTDAQALESSPVPVKVHLGKGLGAGNVPEVAKVAAEEKRDEIRDKIKDARMLFIAAGMGGGTGTGAAPVVASIAKEIELAGDEVTSILTVAIVTTPFTFEGRKRIEQAKLGIAELRKHVDAILVINNDKLREFGKMTLNEAFAMADNVLTTAAKGISEIITVRSYVQIDFKDVNTVMHNSGVALMGFGTANGETRAKDAVMMAMDSPLLNDNSIEGAKNMLLYLGYSSESPLCMDEIETITGSILEKAGDGVDLIWGAGEDDSLGGNLNITLIATGFNERKVLGDHEVRRISLDETFEETKAEKAPAQPHPAPVAPVVPEIKATLAETPAVAAQPAPVAPVAPVAQEVPVQAPVKRQVAVLDMNSDAEPVFQEEKPQTVAQEAPLLDFELPHKPARQEEAAPVARQETVSETVSEEADDWFKQISHREEPAFMVDFPEPTAEKKEEVENYGMPTMVRQEQVRQEEDLFTAAPAAVEEKQMNAQENVVRQAPAVEVAEPVAQVAQKSTVADGLLRGRCEATAERMQRLREFSGLIRTPQGLRKIEEVPAYMRQNITIDPVVPSSYSEANRNTISKDGSVNYNTPPFLTDNAD
ncbi:MAG: cell division protein FtsZ [Bacteroides sp.]|nr:cell division protein FtsZ [Ruminococcus flavefaciens]MCM1554141.1 cell division protein FtsZ [Bacteroides sp.]